MGKKSRKTEEDGGDSSLTPGALGCLLLFALPFALIGTGVGSVLVHDLWTWQRARWVQTPATLLDASLDKDNDDDGVTYRVIATYTYLVGGQKYTSARVGLHDGADNIGHWHEQRAAELEQIKKNGGPLFCYVDPGDPHRAMLYRDLRPGMLAFKAMFALVFGGVGFGLLAGSAFAYRAQKRTERHKKAMPDSPWMWRDDWAAGRVRSSDVKSAWGLSIFAAIWNVFCWPIFFMVWLDKAKGGGGGPPILFVALFPLVGTGVAAWAGYLWLRRIRWGISEFELAATPGVLGGPVAGVIHVPRAIRAEDGFTLRLACTKKTTTTSGGETSTTTETLWEKEQKIDRDLSAGEGGETLIPVKFLAPYDKPSSGDKVTWLLEAKAETLGIDYFASFEIPVFKTATSSPKAVDLVDADADDDAESDEPEDFARTVARLGARLDMGMDGGQAIKFPMARNRGLATFMFLFAVVWTGACVALWMSSAPLVFGITCSLIEVAVIYALVLTCFHSTQLDYGRRGIVVTHRWIGFGRRRETPRDAIQAIGVTKSGVTFGDVEYREVFASTTGGKMTLVSEIPRKADADRIAADIREQLGLEEKKPSPAKTQREAEMKLDAALPDDFLDEAK